MKTKILSCLAVLLLTSASAFAQNAAKADVNDDGIVDVADVVSVAAIKKAGGEIAVTSIELAAAADAYTGLETQLTPTILPKYATDKTITWTSSNTGVATVSDAGLVTGVAEGTATITATTANGKTATCVVTVHQTQYYWYIGQTDPSTMTEISPIVDDNSSPGWRLIGTTLPNYNSSNRLWNGINNPIDFPRSYSYIAVPYQPLQMYDDTGGDGMFYTIQNSGNPTIIDGVQYYIYKSDYKTIGFGMNIYNK